MDDLGLVSIITPTYNCAQYIGETIDSVISQTYIYWEMIIVDDCSSDDTEEIVSKYQKQDARIKYYRLIKIQVQRWLVLWLCVWLRENIWLF